MSCSFCTETIRKAYGRQEGVKEVHVSLSHEEALIHYVPKRPPPPRYEKLYVAWATRYGIRTKFAPSRSRKKNCASNAGG